MLIDLRKLVGFKGADVNRACMLSKIIIANMGTQFAGFRDRLPI